MIGALEAERSSFDRSEINIPRRTERRALRGRASTPRSDSE